MTQIQTLHRYNRRRQRNKTQRANKKKHGGRNSYSYSYSNGKHYDFDDDDKFNVSQLDTLMKSKVPLVVRHHSNSCPHCTDLNAARLASFFDRS